jgi:hypothetical protein
MRRVTITLALLTVVARSASVAAQATAPSAGVPDSLIVARERALWRALQAQDAIAFAQAMGSGVVDADVSGVRRVTAASTAQYVKQCRVTTHTLSGFRVIQDSVTAVVTYKAEVDETCWGQKAPSPLYVLSVYEKRATGWTPVAHSETPAAHW